MAERKVNPPVLKSEDIVVSPPGVFLWPKFFEADDLDDKFKVVLVVDPEHADFAPFAKTIKAFARQAFPDGFPPRLAWCLRAGSDFARPDKKMSDEARELCQGKMVILPKTKFDPNVSYLKDGALVRATEADKSKFYSGAIGSVAGVLEAYSGQYPSITLRLNEVAKLADGDRIGGRDPNKVFAGMTDEADENIGRGEDTGGDLDDEIPF